MRRDAARERLQEVRPLDRFNSFKLKLGVLVGTTILAASVLVWLGASLKLSPAVTIPAAVLIGLGVTQILARGMTSPLREMTAAAVAMSKGDYSREIHASSRDEIGELARAFTRMSAQLEQTDTMRRELVANVSHELRTPVAALQAQLENIVDGVVQPDKRSLEVALAQTERLSTLVSELLDLSRLEAGVAPLSIELLTLTPFLREVVDGAELVNTSNGRDVHFVVTVQPADLTVPADPDRLHQVIANLLDNASRFSPPGGTVHITAERVGPEALAEVLPADEPPSVTAAHRILDLAPATDRQPSGRPDGAIVLDVSDDGPGIAPEHREEVFERFRGSAASAPMRSTGGTGLGLAIARWAVTLHGGRIFVLEQPADGASPPQSESTIRVVLPEHPIDRDLDPGSAAQS